MNKRHTHCVIIFCRLKYDDRIEILVARSKEGNSYTIVGYINYRCAIYSLEKNQIMDFLWTFFFLYKVDFLLSISGGTPIYLLPLKSLRPHPHHR